MTKFYLVPSLSTEIHVDSLYALRARLIKYSCNNKYKKMHVYTEGKILSTTDDSFPGENGQVAYYKNVCMVDGEVLVVGSKTDHSKSVGLDGVLEFYVRAGEKNSFKLSLIGLREGEKIDVEKIVD